MSAMTTFMPAAENELYILTHPETEALVAARSEEMAGAFARWRAFRAQTET